MSIAIGHFAAGAGIILLGYQIVRPEIRRKVPNKWLMAILAGLWAMFPDLSQFVKRLEGFHDSLWANIGFFHQIMDWLDMHDSIWVSAVLVVFMGTIVVSLLMSDIWHLLRKK